MNEGIILNTDRLMKRQNVHGQVLNSLGAHIAAGELPALAVLTLGGLEEEYQVSRTVVREVVRVLESCGMLISRRRIGITVQPIDQWDALNESVIQWRLAGPGRDRQLVELMELRRAIEPAATRLAAGRASDEQRRRLTELAAVVDSLAQRRLEDSPEFLESDVAFHVLLIVASGNLLLAKMAGPVTELIKGCSSGQFSQPLEDETFGGHSAVADAVRTGDANAAAESSSSLLMATSMNQ